MRLCEFIRNISLKNILYTEKKAFDRQQLNKYIYLNIFNINRHHRLIIQL